MRRILIFGAVFLFASILLQEKACCQIKYRYKISDKKVAEYVVSERYIILRLKNRKQFKSQENYLTEFKLKDKQDTKIVNQLKTWGVYIFEVGNQFDHQKLINNKNVISIGKLFYDGNIINEELLVSLDEYIFSLNNIIEIKFKKNIDDLKDYINKYNYIIHKNDEKLNLVYIKPKGKVDDPNILYLSNLLTENKLVNYSNPDFFIWEGRKIPGILTDSGNAPPGKELSIKKEISTNIQEKYLKKISALKSEYQGTIVGLTAPKISIKEGIQSLAIHWNYDKDSPNNINEFKIYRQDEDENHFSIISHSYKSEKNKKYSFIDNNVEKNKYYFYYLTSARKDGIESKTSNIIKAQLMELPIPNIENTEKDSLIVWEKTGAHDIKGYNLYVSKFKNSHWSLISKIPNLSISSYALPNLPKEGPYYLLLKVLTSNNEVYSSTAINYNYELKNEKSSSNDSDFEMVVLSASSEKINSEIVKDNIIITWNGLKGSENAKKFKIFGRPKGILRWGKKELMTISTPECELKNLKNNFPDSKFFILTIEAEQKDEGSYREIGELTIGSL